MQKIIGANITQVGGVFFLFAYISHRNHTYHKCTANPCKQNFF